MPDFTAVRQLDLRRGVMLHRPEAARWTGVDGKSMEPRQKFETTHLGPVQSINHMLLILELGTLDTRVARSAVQNRTKCQPSV